METAGYPHTQTLCVQSLVYLLGEVKKTFRTAQLHFPPLPAQVFVTSKMIKHHSHSHQPDHDLTSQLLP